jgi:beta-ribofuranosylaminobenzene 5'-phosphate synthase
MNGEIGRIDGGVGLAVESPHTVIEATPSNAIRVDCRDEPEIVGRVVEALENVCTAYGLNGAYVNVKERPLPHVGLGSATQTLVGAAHAVCLLSGIQRPSRELARLVGRGGTSGIGVAAIENGGFIVDGGHRFRRGQNDKQEYTPSAASVGIEPPPVLMRVDFADWDVLIVVPLGEGASGLREVALFKVVCPIPIEQVRQMCHVLLMQMMPAIVEQDLESFGQAMEGFQELGFKVFELRAQTKLLIDCLAFLRENGGIGVGMSSWGPAVYAFGQDLRSLAEQSREWLDAHGGGAVVLTKADNKGMRTVLEE